MITDNILMSLKKLICPGLFRRIIELRQQKKIVSDDMALVPWDVIEQIANLTRAWEMWKQSFLAVANLHVLVNLKGELETARIPG